MDLKQLIKEIRDSLNDTDELSILADWDHKLSTEYAWIGAQLADVKKDRAKTEIEIKMREILNGKVTEKEIERIYFSTEAGQYYVFGTEMMKAIGRLISAVRFKRDLERDKRY